MPNTFLANVGKVLLFNGNNELIAIYKSLTQSAFNFAISTEEVRGGMGNALLGKYFHDSSLTVTMENPLFDISDIARNLGLSVEMGGVVLYESSGAGETVSAGGTITLTHTPVAFNGTTVAWYKKPSETNWSVATVSGTTLTIPGAQTTDKYCVKYFWQNDSAKSAIIKVNRIPEIVHAVIINDIYSGDPADQSGVTTYGRLIADIPSLQFSGEQDLSLTSTSAATVSLTGSANAISSGSGCSDDLIYGTMTQEIFGSSWKDSVVALAIENADIAIGHEAPSNTATLIVRAVYGTGIPSQRKENSNFTFAVESGNTYASVGATTGVVTGSAAGEAVISATLTGYGKVAYATVTVS